MRRHGASRPARNGFLLLLVAFAGGLAPGARTIDVAHAAGDPVPAIELKLPPDIVYERTVGADSAVTFSHGTHVALAENRCTGCHPRTFRILHPTHRVRHAEMNAGGSCGQCHDGKQAFGVRDTVACHSCHSGRAASVVAAKDGAGAAASPARKLPKAYRFTSKDAPGTVVFRHETHLKGQSACAPCHPKPFAFKAPPGGMAMHSACGSCHDARKAFGVEDIEKCTRCHKEGGQ